MNMVKTSRCNVTAVTTLIKKYVPDAGLESNAGAELSFVLPHESSNRCAFKQRSGMASMLKTPFSIRIMVQGRSVIKCLGRGIHNIAC